MAYPAASASSAIGMSCYCAAASATNDASTDTHDSELRAWQTKYSEGNMNLILGAPEDAPVCPQGACAQWVRHLREFYRLRCPRTSDTLRNKSLGPSLNSKHSANPGVCGYVWAVSGSCVAYHRSLGMCTTAGLVCGAHVGPQSQPLHVAFGP